MTIESDCLTGTLGEFSLADIIQLINMGGKSGRLALVNGFSDEGSLYFEGGFVVHASVGSLEGEGAAQSLIALAEGTFKFTPGERPGKKTVMLAGYELLMRVAQKVDEEAFLECGGQLVLQIEESNDNLLAQSRERIKCLLQARLGQRSEQPLAAIETSGDTVEGLLAACERIERYIALFISEVEAEEAGREMREVIGLI
ncbi:MAG: DUF4388 domain-containing protein [bacterium]|nr:DUF4388 domain-containing protein [bacterium]MDT8366298.1 DUF4388 domain-containing protein [bacterium]